MRKSFIVAVGILLTASVAAAQHHENKAEKPAKDQIFFSTDVVVGKTVLKAGEYRINCDTEKMTFTLMYEAKDAERIMLLDPLERANVVGNGKKVLELKCKGESLLWTSATTETEYADGNGPKTLKKLFLRGSNIAHVFD